MKYRDPSTRRPLSSMTARDMDRLSRSSALAAIDAHTSRYEPDCHKCRDRGCDYCAVAQINQTEETA